jgi:hypothetical protein
MIAWLLAHKDVLAAAQSLLQVLVLITVAIAIVVHVAGGGRASAIVSRA